MKVEDITNGYCTQFLINKYEGASAAKMRAFAAVSYTHLLFQQKLTNFIFAAL